VSDPKPPGESPEELDYEAARDELVSVVQRLEAGASTLEESMQLWERGEALVARCRELLDQAKARIDRLEAQRPPEETAES
jgi:exodeoxyribonuclease VII small subunit